MPLRSIGFEGSYGRGPATVVGVGGEVRGVVIRNGAIVGEVAIESGDDEGDPSNGTSAVPRGVDDAVLRVVEVGVDPRFVEGVVDDRLVEGEEDVVSDKSPGDRVEGGPAVTRLAPPEHETAIIVKASTPTTVKTLRTAGYAMVAAYAKP